MDEKSGLLFRCCVLIAPNKNIMNMATVKDEVLQELSIQQTQLNVPTHSHTRGKGSFSLIFNIMPCTSVKGAGVFDNENIEEELEGLFLAVNYRKKNNALLKSSGSMVLHGLWFSAILQNQSIY